MAVGRIASASAEAGEQVGTCDLQLRPTRQLGMWATAVQDHQSSAGALGHRYRDSPVGFDDRTRLVAHQLAVERRDSPTSPLPRRGGGAVACGDRCLQLIGADRPGPHRGFQQGGPLLDLGFHPLGSVLFGQQHQVPGRPTRAGRRASVSSSSASNPTLRARRAAIQQHPGQPDRLSHSPFERCLWAMSLGEDEIDDAQHCGQPFGQSCRGGARSGMPDCTILRLARTRRCAMVGSGTRNTAAISSVVRSAHRAQRQAIRTAGSKAG